jgi:AcrR family transcriptional regulator
MDSSEARQRVLDAAERLFGEKGYDSVTVKDIARAVGIHHASLYHHVGGKEQLFVEVTERNLLRHRKGLQQAIESSAPTLRTQLQSVAAWLLAQPPVDLIRLTLSDMPAISPASQAKLSNLAHESILVPIAQVLYAAQARGEVQHDHIGNITGAIFAMIEILHTVPSLYLEQSRQDMANDLIDIVIRGIGGDV